MLLRVSLILNTIIIGTEVLRLILSSKAWGGNKNIAFSTVTRLDQKLIIIDMVLSRAEPVEAFHIMRIASHARTGRAAKFLARHK